MAFNSEDQSILNWADPSSFANREDIESLVKELSVENLLQSHKEIDKKMDRGEGIVRWSPNAARDEFISINITYRVLERHRAVGLVLPELFEQQSLSKHSDVPLLTAFDWSPRVGGLVAIGTKAGEVHLLRVDDDSSDDLILPLKLQRACQAVSFNTTGLLAVGLERVRNDQCLQIWDINQLLAKWDPAKKGWQSTAATVIEPVHKLEPSVAISSVRFFEDQPQTLVVGVKNQNVRIHDLRDPNSAVITFPTRCNNNLTIDHADSNYFASSALDLPAVMVWDRRASSRQSCSKMYLDSVDSQEVPFGCALKVNKAIEYQQGAYIRSLRYCRDKRGHLGVLSSSGELQVLYTETEFIDSTPDNAVEGSPELLEIKRSHPLHYPFFDESFGYHVDDRIVSFDWITLGSSEFQPRVVTRNCKQLIEVKLMPSTAEHVAFDFINFSGRARFSKYFEFPHFKDPKETEFVLGDVAKIEARRNAVFRAAGAETSKTASVVDSNVDSRPTVSTDMRKYAANNFGWLHDFTSKRKTSNGSPKPEDALAISTENLSASYKPLSSREAHGIAHWSSILGGTDTEPVYNNLNKMFRSRAMKGYLFDCEKNRSILSDNAWLQDVWVWIEGAEESASDDGMVSGHLDLKYVGVHAVWNNDIGHKYKSRLIGSETLPNPTEWEHAIENINKKHQRDRFEGLKTKKPHHRQLCLAICGWNKPPLELDEELKELEERGHFTKAATLALCERVPKLAVDILKRGGKDLLFIALALDLYTRGAKSVDKIDWDEILHSHPQMRNDPYLRAIYALISTGDWKAIADETSLPLKDRVGIALRNFDDAQLTDWLEAQMKEAVNNGDIEGIVLAGITDKMVDILATYVAKFGDYQSATLIMSFGYPLYISDYRTAQWRANYRDWLNAVKLHVLRCRFDVQSTKKSIARDGTSIIKPKPRQVTLRCVHCDSSLTNDADNTANPTQQTSQPSSSVAIERNPLYPSGVHAGIQCPKCGRHLPRCAICLNNLGMPRSERPELSTEKQDPMANFLTFCMKCDHGFHASHAKEWFERHDECPVTSCHCKCNQTEINGKQLHGPRDEEEMH